MEPQFTNVKLYEEHAKKIMKKMYFDYYMSGADDEYTLNNTESAFNDIKLKARALGNADAFENTETTILGYKIPSPICLAPTTWHKLAHSDGEIATAKAWDSTGTLLCLTSNSNYTLEDVAEAAPKSLKIFQFYFTKSKETNQDILKRIEAANYKALVIVVDNSVLGNREANKQNKFYLPENIEIASITKYLAPSSNGDKGSGSWERFKKYKNTGFTWSDLAEVRQMTKLPIILKGIQWAEDAKKAVESGVDAIWVSNNGARQLDTTPATIEVLEECVKAVAGKIEVYFDGGVRRGTHVLKALALGARAVFIGRPLLWGLACNGQRGVEEVITILNEELKRAMVLTNCKNIFEITKERVIHSSYSNPKYFTSKM
jgi:(S)-2-hydroxy-acid oxidase